MNNYTDHLGNVRVSYTQDPQTGALAILEENHYYPFGLQHKNYNSDLTKIDREEELKTLKEAAPPTVPLQNPGYKYKFNGIELQDEFDLNMYSMDFRQYDPAIGRFTSQDPVTHFDYSPYSAFDNNPAYWADPSGADAESLINDLWNQSGSGRTSWTNNNDGTFSDGNGNSAQCDDCKDKDKKTGYYPGKHDKAASKARELMVTPGAYSAAMRGGDPYNPTQGDIDSEGEAFFQAVLFVSGEWAAVKVLQGGIWVVRIIKSKNIAKSAKYVNLASESRTAHILAGDATGGGHAWWGSLNSFWNGVTGAKTMFPMSWSNNKIMNAISEVATSNQWVQQTGRAGATHTRSGQLVRYKIEGVYNGVKMRVITTTENIITAYPIK